MGRWGQVLRTPVGLVAVLGVGAVVALAVLGPLLWADDAARFDFTAVSQGASREHPLGTDALGRDILLRVLVAARLSIVLALIATVIGAALGITLGALSTMLMTMDDRR